jgi:hypothetical protein
LTVTIQLILCENTRHTVTGQRLCGASDTVLARA